MAPKATRKVIPVKTKKEIIFEFESGQKVNALARKFSLSHSTVSAILKNSEKLKSTKVIGETSRIQPKRDLVAEMETLLLAWITNKQVKGEILNTTVISQRAKLIYEDLKKNHRGDIYINFSASRGWFNRFRKRADSQCIALQAGNVNKEETTKFLQTLGDFIKENQFLSQQDFNNDETGLNIAISGVDKEKTDIHDQASAINSKDVKEFFKSWVSVKTILYKSTNIKGAHEAISAFENNQIFREMEELGQGGKQQPSMNHIFSSKLSPIEGEATPEQMNKSVFPGTSL